ncbi:hydrogenase [Pseudohalioglobus sediminis]|uniref:Hydrogenase n=1 Tax=Pseudohalioglobus sediminis TaxID=2606449 RepID=A0A5B0X423_9GAMM|nr:cytochrome b/b6 domain-containing protein [Pseudohalioglobus sediminis]KAA1194110.1 hydrogenase [Pseudohalioglobus sediminis]
MSKGFVLWDVPTRVFHWSVVACVGLAWWSGEQGRNDIHEWTGYTLIVLVFARILWGVVGSVHSRFSDFVRGPGAVIGYLRGRGSPTPGHNPLGALSVLALLALLLAQGISGLFNSDDILFSGPLYYAASTDWRDTMGVVHEVAFDLLLVLVALHVLVVAYHQFMRKDGMITAMFTGRAPGRVGTAAPVAAWKALVLLALVAGLLWLGLEQAPQPQPLW